MWHQHKEWASCYKQDGFLQNNSTSICKTVLVTATATVLTEPHCTVLHTICRALENISILLMQITWEYKLFIQFQIIPSKKRIDLLLTNFLTDQWTKKTNQSTNLVSPHRRVLQKRTFPRLNTNSLSFPERQVPLPCSQALDTNLVTSPRRNRSISIVITFHLPLGLFTMVSFTFMGLNCWKPWVYIRKGWERSRRHRVTNSWGALPASYPTGTGSYFNLVIAGAAT